MPPDIIRTLPFGTGLVLLRAAPPIVTRLRTWTSRPDARVLLTDQSVLEGTLQQPPPSAPDAPTVAKEEMN